MKTIFYCPNCKKTFSSDLKETLCQCGGKLYDTKFQVEKWRLLRNEEKQFYKNEWEQEIQQEIQQEISRTDSIIMSTTNQLEGFRIKKYLGIVGGTDIYLVGGLLGGGLGNQEKLFGSAYEIAKEHLKSNTLEKYPYANAVIGITTEVTSPGTTANIIVIVTGTAVIVEPISEA